MVVDLEPALLRDFDLAAFDFRIVKLFDVTALHTYDVVVMTPLLEFEHRFAALEMVSHEKPSLLELREHAVYGREARVGAVFQERFVDILRREMPHVALLEDFENA
jgi:hypothetical protein